MFMFFKHLVFLIILWWVAVRLIQLLINKLMERSSVPVEMIRVIPQHTICFTLIWIRMNYENDVVLAGIISELIYETVCLISNIVDYHKNDDTNKNYLLVILSFQHFKSFTYFLRFRHISSYLILVPVDLVFYIIYAFLSLCNFKEKTQFIVYYLGCLFLVEIFVFPLSFFINDIDEVAVGNIFLFINYSLIMYVVNIIHVLVVFRYMYCRILNKEEIKKKAFKPKLLQLRKALKPKLPQLRKAFTSKF